VTLGITSENAFDVCIAELPSEMCLSSAVHICFAGTQMAVSGMHRGLYVCAIMLDSQQICTCPVLVVILCKDTMPGTLPGRPAHPMLHNKMCSQCSSFKMQECMHGWQTMGGTTWQRHSASLHNGASGWYTFRSVVTL
jgi:hypothetical protein